MMDERKWQILEAIIREYILTAEPIGSRTLTRRYDLGISAATIRNEMSDLEELGFLEQPHASAGRIPSDLGYRTFVDAILRGKGLPSVSEEVKKIYVVKKRQIQDLIEETTKFLSRTTHYLSLGMAPDVKQTIFQHIQLIPLVERKVVAVMVTNTGMVQNQILDMPVNLDAKELGQISDFLNSHLQGRTLQEIDFAMMKNLENELVNRYDLLADVFKTLYTDLLCDVHSKLQQIFMEGTINMMDHPEFADVNKLKTVMGFFEQRELLYNILQQNDDHIQITIGQENPVKEMQNCSIISATYSVNGKPVGRIGVVGPTRMEYGKVISLLQYVTEVLSRSLSESDE